MENVDIRFDTLGNDNSTIKLNTEQTSAIGPGIELLMNGKRKDKKNTDVEININDLDNLENELNNLSNPVQKETLSSN